MGLEFLSMGWIYAAPAFIGGLVLLYFLKLKRRVVVTSSTFLWHRALNDLRVNSPLQRLRMNILLFLQLLALIALLLALARPASNVGGLEGVDSILLIDVSASMQTQDGDGGTRFEQAIEEAKRKVEDLSRGDRAIVMAFADDVRVLTDMTDSKTVLLEALEGLAPTDRPTRAADAIHRVRALVGKDRDTEVWVFSDGRVGNLEDVPLDQEVDVFFRPAGEATRNVGIVGVDVNVASGLGDETRVFVSVQNNGNKEQDEPRTLGVDFHIDGELVDSREVTVNPGGVGSVPFEVPLFDETSPTRRVQVKLDNEDAFPRDDVAYALIKEREPIKVLIVTGGNLFLFHALNEDPLIWKTPRGDVPLMSPEEFDPDDPRLEAFDVIVLDRFTPERIPRGNYLCFGARPPLEEFKDMGQAEGSKVLDWEETHDVARFVNFATLNLATSRRFSVSPRYEQVVRGTFGPIVVDAREGDVRALVCSFDLLSFPVEGAWTFDPSFPIFLANAIRLLGGGSDSKSKGWLVRTGTTGELHFPTAAVKAEVQPPVGDAYDLAIVEGDEVLHLTRLDHAGIYTVTFKDEDGGDLKTTSVAVNLANAEESDIAPADEFVLADRETVTATETVETNKEIWKVVALAALAFVMLEWWIYNRRVFI